MHRFPIEILLQEQGARTFCEIGIFLNENAFLGAANNFSCGESIISQFVISMFRDANLPL